MQIFGRRAPLPARQAILAGTLLLLAALAAGAEEVQRNIKTPSPNGRYAFLEIVEPEYERQGTVDLIEQKSGKVLCRVEEEIAAGWSALWSRDSRRVAIRSRVSHAMQAVELYARTGASFREVKLPDLDARIPEKLKRHKAYGHTSMDNFQTPVRWNKDGTLELEIETMIEGESGSILAERHVTLAFTKSGRPVVRKSTVKYTSSKL